MMERYDGTMNIFLWSYFYLFLVLDISGLCPNFLLILPTGASSYRILQKYFILLDTYTTSASYKILKLVIFHSICCNKLPESIFLSICHVLSLYGFTCHSYFKTIIPKTNLAFGDRFRIPEQSVILGSFFSDDIS